MAHELSWFCGSECSEDMPEGIGARLKLALHYGMIQSKMLRPYSFNYLPHHEGY